MGEHSLGVPSLWMVHLDPKGYIFPRRHSRRAVAESFLTEKSGSEIRVGGCDS